MIARLPLVRFLCICYVVSAMLSSAARAQIKQAEAPLTTQRFVTNYEKRAEALNLYPLPLTGSQCVAMYSHNGVVTTVVVLVPKATDPQLISIILKDWSTVALQGARIEWSIDDEAVAVKATRNRANIGSMSCISSVDFSSLEMILRQRFPTLRSSLSSDNWSDINIARRPNCYSPAGSIRYWKVSGPKDMPQTVTAKAQASTGILSLAVLWLFFMPVVATIQLVLGLKIINRESEPLEKRRVKYRRVVLGGTYRAIFVHALLTVFVLPTRLFDPLAYLWFGDTFSRWAIMVMMPLMALGIGVLLVLGYQEQRLRTPPPEQVIERAPYQPPGRDTTLRMSVLGYKLGIISMWAVSIVSLAILNQIVVLPVLIGAMIHVCHLLKKIEFDVVTNEQYSAALNQLEAEVADVARKMGSKPIGSKITTSHEEPMIDATRKEVNMAIYFFDNTIPEERAFAIAHELARFDVRKDKGRRIVLLTFILICILITVFGVWRAEDQITIGRARFSSATLYFIVSWILYLLSQKISERNILSADALAFRTFPDLDLAISALTKIYRGREQKFFDPSGTNLQARIDALRLLANAVPKQ